MIDKRKKDEGAKYIYGLVDPRDGIVRYVGASATPIQRYLDHVKKVNAPSWDMRKWLESLETEKMRPDLRMLTITKSKEWRKKEIAAQDQHGATLIDQIGRHRAIKREYLQEEVGEALRTAREQAGYSVAAVAATMGTSSATVSRWENGSRSPNIRQLLKVADTYGMTVDQVLPMGQSQGSSEDSSRARSSTGKEVAHGNEDSAKDPEVEGSST